MSDIEQGVLAIKATIQTLKNEPGVYRMLDSLSNVLYVGKAKNLPQRLRSYTQIEQLPVRLKRMVSQTVSLEIMKTQTEVEALLLENNLIKKFKPPFNVLLKDDKSYPYICITNDHTYPRILKYRGNKSKNGDYFGPFANVQAVDEAILSLQKLFMIRGCKDTFFANRKRPCLQYHIKRCSAPCVNKISIDDYSKNISLATDFLKGKTTHVQNYFIQKMEKTSLDLEFEQAAKYRDQIKLLTSIQEKQRIEIQDINNADVLAILKENNTCVVHCIFYRNGKNYGYKNIFLTPLENSTLEENLNIFLNQFYTEHDIPDNVLLNCEPFEFALIQQAFKDYYKKNTVWEFPKIGSKKDLISFALSKSKEALILKTTQTDSLNDIFLKLKETFNLEDIPERIEIYDNSHIQGSHPVGVMVIATPDGFDKKNYRKFNLERTNTFGGDDFAMMKEVLTRRFGHQNDWGLPDLLLIDGGIGQINAVKSILKTFDLNIPLIGISKGKDRNAGKEYFIMEGKEPFQLDFKSPLLYFLQRLRDESHRFAITTHRKKRIQNISKSSLDDIPNIGSKRKKILLQHFGSLEGVKLAPLESLKTVKGISEQLAKQIFDFLRDF
ncbi:MAG: excinuclease ABC subunit UvrC [Proteobacteria bacterium]|nr:excinuclease ABC subunit UvrC [Pseudomonadota bacterium]